MTNSYGKVLSTLSSSQMTASAPVPAKIVGEPGAANKAGEVAPVFGPDGCATPAEDVSLFRRTLDIGAAESPFSAWIRASASAASGQEARSLLRSSSSIFVFGFGSGRRALWRERGDCRHCELQRRDEQLAGGLASYHTVHWSRADGCLSAWEPGLQTHPSSKPFSWRE